ncbi:MAG: crossover junction endodeoxyribonuclease RuvC [Spirochaetae bacterium HGW-Spirochaetae-5]|nr:MAG: crossover junction endodeoxyribonuclease RuvC [Spirochaetae bacterium HGW-Spirochaetae-5]
MASNQKILGIDPGYDIVGWSILNDNFKVENYGVIKTSPGEEFDERLLSIHRGLNNIIEEFKPNCAAVEKVFFQKNVKTAIPVAKAVGVILLTLKLKGIVYTEYSPTEIKHSVTGYGRATKDQIYFMMKKLLKLDSIEGPDDAADALAIAICHQISGKNLSLK